MHLRDWLWQIRTLWNSTLRTNRAISGTRRTPRPRRQTQLLLLERLEDRALLSGANVPPIAQPDSATMSASDTSLEIAVLANDFDPDGDQIFLGSVTGTMLGSSVSSTANGTVIFSPSAAARLYGYDYFSYMIISQTVPTGGEPPQQNGAASAIVTVSITGGSAPGTPPGTPPGTGPGDPPPAGPGEPPPGGPGEPPPSGPGEPPPSGPGEPPPTGPGEPPPSGPGEPPPYEPEPPPSGPGEPPPTGPGEPPPYEPPPGGPGEPPPYEPPPSGPGEPPPYEPPPGNPGDPPPTEPPPGGPGEPPPYEPPPTEPPPGGPGEPPPYEPPPYEPPPGNPGDPPPYEPPPTEPPPGGPGEPPPYEPPPYEPPPVGPGEPPPGPTYGPPQILSLTLVEDTGIAGDLQTIDARVQWTFSIPEGSAGENDLIQFDWTGDWQPDLSAQLDQTSPAWIDFGEYLNFGHHVLWARAYHPETDGIAQYGSWIALGFWYLAPIQLQDGFGFAYEGGQLQFFADLQGVHDSKILSAGVDIDQDDSIDATPAEDLGDVHERVLILEVDQLSKLGPNVDNDPYFPYMPLHFVRFEATADNGKTVSWTIPVHIFIDPPQVDLQVSSEGFAFEPVTIDLDVTNRGPDSIQSITVNWGDGSPLETFSGWAGLSEFSTTLTHTYVKIGYFDVEITVADEDKVAVSRYEVHIFDGRPWLYQLDVLPHPSNPQLARLQAAGVTWLGDPLSVTSYSWDFDNDGDFNDVYFYEGSGDTIDIWPHLFPHLPGQVPDQGVEEFQLTGTLRLTSGSRFQDFPFQSIVNFSSEDFVGDGRKKIDYNQTNLPYVVNQADTPFNPELMLEILQEMRPDVHAFWTGASDFRARGIVELLHVRGMLTGWWWVNKWQSIELSDGPVGQRQSFYYLRLDANLTELEVAQQIIYESEQGYFAAEFKADQLLSNVDDFENAVEMQKYWTWWSQQSVNAAKTGAQYLVSAYTIAFSGMDLLFTVNGYLEGEPAKWTDALAVLDLLPFLKHIPGVARFQDAAGTVIREVPYKLLAELSQRSKLLPNLGELVDGPLRLLSSIPNAAAKYEALYQNNLPGLRIITISDSATNVVIDGVTASIPTTARGATFGTKQTIVLRESAHLQDLTHELFHAEIHKISGTWGSATQRSDEMAWFHELFTYTNDIDAAVLRKKNATSEAEGTALIAFEDNARVMRREKAHNITTSLLASGGNFDLIDIRIEQMLVAIANNYGLLEFKRVMRDVIDSLPDKVDRYLLDRFVERIEKKVLMP